MRYFLVALLLVSLHRLNAETNDASGKYLEKSTHNQSSLIKEFSLLEKDEFSIITPRRRPVGLSFILFGPTIISSLQLDYFVTEEVQLDAGLGLFGGFFGGKYHFILNKPAKGAMVKDDYFQDMKELVKQNRAKKKSIYVGLDLTVAAVLEFDYNYLDVWIGKGVYMPVGIQWKGQKGFSYSIEMAYLGLKEDPTSPTFNNRSLNALYFALKTGFYF